MSFMTQGSDDEAQRDEPDLGDSDDGEQVGAAASLSTAANGDVVNHDEPAEIRLDDNESERIEDELVSETSSHDDDNEENMSQRAASPQNELPTHIPHPPSPSGRERGLLSDAESIPDDSPSVQVCRFPPFAVCVLCVH